MTEEDLCYLSATKAMSLFASRKLSPVELTEALIRRAESVADTVNPFADRYFDEALANARKAEAKYASGKRTRRLEGVPMAVKDSAGIKGRRSTSGSAIHRNRIDEATDPAISRLLSAGANLFARTTCPEFCWLLTTHSRLWGVTRNPWRLDAAAGGSSGGSAAALAAGAVTIATGSDSTGSIRQPASQCGVIGWLPPLGRVPVKSETSFHRYIHEGPMTRTIADARLMANLMSGYHADDPHSLRERVTIPEHLPDVKGLKIAYSYDLGCYPVIADVRREMRAVLDALADAGAEVVEVDVDWAKIPVRLAHLHEEFLACPDLEQMVAEHGDMLSDYVPELIETARSATAQDFRAAVKIAGGIWRRYLVPLFTEFDSFICPTVASPEIPASNWQRSLIEVDGQRFTDTELAMTALFNMFGTCPVLAVPSGRTDAGLPTGIQIAAGPYDDVTPFRIGAVLEQRRPWLDISERRPQLDAAGAIQAASIEACSPMPDRQPQAQSEHTRAATSKTRIT